MVVRLAYCAYPHDNGVFAFYRALRAALLPHGVIVHCVSVGDAERQHWDARFVDEGCVAVSAGPTPKSAARAFVNWCEATDIDVVLPQHSPTALASLKHLPPSIRVVHACMDLFPQALSFYCEIAAQCDRMVAATPRQAWELERRAVPASVLCSIPFAVRTDEFAAQPQPAVEPGQPLRLVWVARLNHIQKGVGWLAPTLQRLDGLNVPWTLDVVGQGSHDALLREQLASHVAGGRVRFHGRLVHRQTAEVLSRSHVYFLPTRYEGFGISIVEAMAAGCAPVVSHLPGVTDYLIEQEVSGLLPTLGSTEAYAAAIARLYYDPQTLLRLRNGARERARERFSLTLFGRAYADLIDELPSHSRRVAKPWSEFVPRATTYRPWWLHRILPGRLVRRALDARERAMARSMPRALAERVRR